MTRWVVQVEVCRGAGYRSWVQRAHKQDKEVVEIRREFLEEHFAGFVEFETTLSDVAKLPRGWRAILSLSRGGYLLTCPRTRERYVGSATGEGGFVARWEQHAAKGGGAVKFRSREPSDYAVSVLAIAGSTAATLESGLSDSSIAMSRALILPSQRRKPARKP